LPLTVAALVLWSCSSGTTNQDAGSTVATPDANRSTVSVAPQSNIPADGASRVVITVTLRDANGTPIPNATVDVTASGSGNLLSLPAMPTNAQGIATATLASRVAERKTLRAHALLSNDTRTTLTARPIVEFVPVLNATALAFVVGPGDTVDGARLEPPVTVEIQDASAQRVPGATGTITLTLQGCAALPQGTLARPAVDGVATFGDLVVRGVSTGCVWRASAAGLPQVDSAAFDVLASARGSLAFVVQPTAVRAGAVLLPAVEVALRDTTGATLPAATPVTLSLLDGAGVVTLLGTTTVTGIGGRAQFSDLSLDRPASGVTLRATAAGFVSAISQPFDVLAISTARLRFTQAPTTATAGETLAPPVRVALEDINGVPLVDQPVVVTLSVVGQPNAVTGTTTHTSVAGTAVFDAVSITYAGAAVELLATATGVSGAVSPPILVTPGPLAGFQFRLPSALAAGVSTPVTVTAVDAFGNTVAGHQGALQWATTDDNATLPLDTSFAPGAGGTLDATVTLTTAGMHTITVTGSGLTGTTAVEVLPAPGVALRFVDIPTTAQVRTLLSPAPSVAVVDAFDNVATASTALVTVALEDAPSGATLDGTLAVNAVRGVATFGDLAAPLEGTTYALRATALALLPAVSNPFTVEDTTPPATVVDLSLAGVTATSLTIRFTAPGDDGVLGQATRYELRHATAPITPQNFAAATPVTGLPTPLLPPGVEQVLVSPLASNTTHHLALKVFDGAGNTSWATASFSTVACPAGYAGQDCTSCEPGFHLGLGGGCVDACTDPNPCSQPPAPSCNGNTAITATGSGACTLQPSFPHFSCSYTNTTRDCAALGQVCVAGACIVDPCIGVTCTPPASSCGADRLTLTTFTAACAPDGPGLFHCQDAFTTTPCQDLGAVCFLGSCVSATPAGAQDVLFTELLLLPTSPTGHFVELTNITPALLDLSGTVLRHSNGATFTLPSSPPVLVAPGDQLVLGDTPGGAVDVGWAGFVPGQTGTLRLLRGTTVLDELTYGAGFPATAGTAMQLANVAMTTDAHTRSWYWCNATSTMPNGDKGSPGVGNSACGITVTQPVDVCRLKAPYDLGPLDATNIPLSYATFSEPGITNRSSTTNDFFPHVDGQAGVGQSPDATHPSWVFVDGAFNSAYTTAGPLDEMVAALSFPSSGLWRWAWRFRLVDPFTGVPGAWTYCDQAGVANPVNGAWGTIQVRPGVTSTSHTVVPRGSVVTVRGAGLLGLTGATLGGVNQPVGVVDASTVTVGPVAPGTPLGSQPLVLLNAAVGSTPVNVTVVDQVLSRTVVAHGSQLSITGAGSATGATVGGINHAVTVNGGVVQLTLLDGVAVGTTGLSLVTPAGVTAPMPLTVVHLVLAELDSDQTGTDTAEFIEVATGVPNVTLPDYSLVLFNGGSAAAYRVVNLEGLTTNAQGLILVGGPALVPTPQVILPGANNVIQNGPDAVALYETVLPDASAPTATGLLDAVVHAVDASEDAALLATLLGTGAQAVTLRETTATSIRRCAPQRLDARAFVQGTPTPGADNGCP